MPRVKCPHCGAGNQDATEQDTCWQCGNVLGAPVARAQTPARAPMFEAGAPTQQLSPDQLANFGATQNQTSGGASQRTLALAAVVTVIVVGLIIVLAVMAFSR